MKIQIIHQGTTKAGKTLYGGETKEVSDADSLDSSTSWTKWFDSTDSLVQECPEFEGKPIIDIGELRF